METTPIIGSKTLYYKNEKKVNLVLQRLIEKDSIKGFSLQFRISRLYNRPTKFRSGSKLLVTHGLKR